MGTDVDPAALESARQIVDKNKLSAHVELRKQESPKQILKSVLSEEKKERFDFLVCNPPFFHSTEERKTRTAHKISAGEETTEGGEVGFVQRMIQESLKFRRNVRWYTSLVGRKVDFEFICRYMKHFVEEAKEVRTGTIDQGQNRRWAVAWSYFDKEEK